MEALFTIITIVWSILGIILFFKIWMMTNNIKEIHDWLMDGRFKNQRSSNELSEEASPTKSLSGILKKGDKVKITGFGLCNFEGIWQGKYAFYPEDKTDLPKSPYLVDDTEPYLLIPSNKLGELIVL